MLHAKQKQLNAYQRKCPNCGAPLRFDPTSGKLVCEHCKSLVEFEQSKDVVERNFTEMRDFTPWGEGEISAYRCANCGASSVLSRTALATTCPFCGSPVVLDEKATGLVRPDSLVPFEVSEREAIALLAAWRKRKVFAPRSFRMHVRAKSIKGVFTPVWTFDADTTSHYFGTLGKHRTRTVRRNGKTETETYTEWFHVSGDISASFDDIMIAGSNNVDGKYFKEVQRVPKSKFTVYSDEYLAGYVADNYTVEPLAAYNLAKSQMESAIRRMIMNRYNADVEGTLSVKTTETSRSFKYMLFPMYVATTKHNGKVFNQFVSGFWTNREKRKASVSGAFPKSWWKILLTVLAGLAVVGGLIALFIYAVNNNGGFESFWRDLLTGWEWDF